MKLYKNLAAILTFTSLLLTSTAQAASRVLIVSDIDDTIKHSHVRSTLDTGLNALINYKAFLGMAELYQTLGQIPESSIYYVSNAPYFIMQPNHIKFLKKFGFPQHHHLQTRENVFSDEFKVDTILQLTHQEQPEILVLIGDNGEHDPRVFQTIRKNLETKPIQIMGFIHQVYSKAGDDEAPLDPLTPDEQLFVTPIEIGLQLMRYGVISTPTFQAVGKGIIAKIIKDARTPEKSMSFPRWKDCSTYQWAIETRQDEPEGIEELKRLIEKRCGRS